MKRLLGWLLLLLLAPLSVSGLEITSVYPQVAFAGSPVTIIGGPFSQQVQVSLAGQQIRPLSVGDRQLVFIVPPLPVGEHALFLREAGHSSLETYSLLIELPPPAISSVSPANLDVCSTTEQRLITLRGENIQDAARLLLDARVIPFTRADDRSLHFTPPPLKAGSYGLQVINPDGKKSLPHTLWFNNIPEIESVGVAGNFVTYYQMLIRGKNFFHNSVLLVNEYPAGFDSLPMQQRFIPAQGGVAYRGARPELKPSDRVIYQDCNTLRYDRYPVSGQSRRIVLRVGNPDGKQTSAYEISLP